MDQHRLLFGPRPLISAAARERRRDEPLIIRGRTLPHIAIYRGGQGRYPVCYRSATLQGFRYGYEFHLGIDTDHDNTPFIVVVYDIEYYGSSSCSTERYPNLAQALAVTNQRIEVLGKQVDHPYRAQAKTGPVVLDRSGFVTSLAAALN